MRADKNKATIPAIGLIFISHPSAGARLLTGKVPTKYSYLPATQILSGLRQTSFSYGGALKGQAEAINASARVTAAEATGAIVFAPTAPMEHSNNTSEPPAILQLVFRILLPARVRDAVLGDAQEAYNDTLGRSGRPWVATTDYVKEVLYATVGGTWMRIERLISLLRRGS